MDVKDLLEVKVLVDRKVILETLCRIGVANKAKKILYPSCYLYTIDNKDYVVHFKELFLLTRDTAYNNLCEDDINRRNAVCFCLSNWGLVEVDEKSIEPHNKFVFVLPHNQKLDWQIAHKFNFRTVNSETDLANHINTTKESEDV